MEMSHQQNQYYQHIYQEMQYFGTQELSKLQLQQLKGIARGLKIPEGQKKMDLIQNILQTFVKWLITQYQSTMDNYQLMTFKTNHPLFINYPLFKSIVEKYNEQCQVKMQLLIQQQLQQQLLSVAPNLQGIYLFGGNGQNVLLPEFQNSSIPYISDRIPQQFIPQALSENWTQYQLKARQSQAMQQAFINKGTNNNQSIVNQECICANYPLLAAMLTPQDNSKTITCHKCFKLYHCACLRVDFDLITKNERKMFECPKCILKSLDPSTEVQQVLIQPCITEEYFQHYFIIDKEMHKLIYSNNNIGIEVRCVRIEGVKNNHEITWPDYGALIINGKRVQEFKPLQINSALKKRKDDKYFCRDNDIRPQQNQIICKREKATAEQKIGSRIDEKAIHMWGVFLVKKLTQQELIEKTLKSSSKDIEQCKAQIESIFSKQTDDGLQIDKIQINLLDPFDFQLIKTPAKGKYCTHLNCFSLENLIMLNESTIPKRWKCPICKNKCYDFIIDSYQQQILKEVKEKPNSEDILEVIFQQNGSYEFKEFQDDEKSQQSQQSGQQIKSEENKNNNTHSNDQQIQINQISADKEEAIQTEQPQQKNKNHNNQPVIILDSDEEKFEEENPKNQQDQQKLVQQQQQLTDEQAQQIQTEQKQNISIEPKQQQNSLNQSELLENKENLSQNLSENQSKLSNLSQNQEIQQLQQIEEKLQKLQEFEPQITKQIKKNPQFENLIQID